MISDRMHHLAAAARPFAPWVLLTAVVGVVAPTFVTGDMPWPAWPIVLISAAVVAWLVSWFGNRNPAAYGLVILVAIVHLTTSDAHRSYHAADALPWVDITIDLLVVIGLAGVLASFMVRRFGAPAVRDLVEVVVLFLGTSIATWVVITEPLLDAGMPLSRASLASLLLPLEILIATFLVDLWSNDERSNRAIQLASVAATLIAVGGATSRVEMVIGHEIPGPSSTSVTYSLAAGFILAAMSHTDFQHDVMNARADVDRAQPKVRLVIMGVAVVAPVTLMSTIAPSGAGDLAARAIATITLIALVVLRLAIAQNEHAEARSSLQRRINSDDLTGLPTRRRFIELVQEQLDENWRTVQHPTVFHLNLDRFKHINDSLGHHGANEVLVELARRLETVAERFDARVGRLGGDDFVIIDGTTRSIDEAMARVEWIERAVNEPFVVNDTTLVVSASIGVAIAPEKRSLSAEELIRRADVANHQAKLEGANRTAVFDDTMQANVAKRMDVEHALHGAIGRQEMRLYHQPIVDVSTGRVTGFESLIRWQRSDGTLVPPNAFIPIAEDTGIIREIGAWALTDALQRLREWIDGGVVDPETTISVNVSQRQISDRDFVNVVRRALDQTDVPARLLWLEMTESMMVEEPDLAETTLRDVRAMGVRWALDDFGTGFSSLSLLQRFPIQRIKIDRAFVQGIADNVNDRSLVRTIIAMAHSMGLDIVAEGVETVHQLQGLRELGCAKAQGYLISRPVPAEAMRTTMGALSELASLSLFSDDDRPMPSHEDHGPVETTPTPLPMSTSSRGPLGQPVL